MADRVSIKKLAKLLLIEHLTLEEHIALRHDEKGKTIPYRRAYEVICWYCEAGEMRNRICQKLGIY